MQVIDLLVVCPYTINPNRRRNYATQYLPMYMQNYASRKAVILIVQFSHFTANFCTGQAYISPLVEIL